RYPIDVLRRMMDRVILPERPAMKHAVQPVHHEIRRDEEDRRLQPNGQLRQRTMPVVIELDEGLRRGDAEQDGSADDQETDAQVAREQRDDEPIADVRDEPAFAPPRWSGITGPAPRQQGEGGPEHDGHRKQLDERHPDTLDDGDDFLEHHATTRLTIMLSSAT